jgi:hypothetical protein
MVNAESDHINDENEEEGGTKSKQVDVNSVPSQTQQGASFVSTYISHELTQEKPVSCMKLRVTKTFVFFCGKLFPDRHGYFGAIDFPTDLKFYDYIITIFTGWFPAICTGSLYVAMMRRNKNIQ